MRRHLFPQFTRWLRTKGTCRWTRFAMHFPGPALLRQNDHDGSPIKPNKILWSAPRCWLNSAAVTLVAAFSVAACVSVSAQVRYHVKDLGTLGGTSSNAIGVNNRGQVNGFSTLPGNQQTHAVFWINGLKIDLGTLGGPNSS